MRIPLEHGKASRRFSLDLTRMMRATEFEFRNRWWLFGVVFGAGFLPLALDPVPIGARIADRLAAVVPLPEPLASHIVFGAVALIMLAAALVRAWGSAYLGREVVHDHAVLSEALKADGPYRHVRNPLYLGNVLMSWAVALFAPGIGWPVIVIGIPLFCYRLIGREEVALEAEQGESYRAFKRAVPRLWPSLGACIPASGSVPDWINGLAAEAFFMSFCAWRHRFRHLVKRVLVLWWMAGFAAAELARWFGGKRATPARPSPIEEVTAKRHALRAARGIIEVDSGDCGSTC